MGKRIAVLLAAVTAAGLAGCGRDVFSISFVDSEYYSYEDMETAVNAIEEEFQSFNGCDMKEVYYAGDDAVTTDNLDWMNELGEAKGLGTFDEVIEFKSNFHTSRFGVTGGFNANTDYKDWEWWLARKRDGEWHVVTSGY